MTGAIKSEQAMESYTATGHLVGMLDRDQRTAKLPIFDEIVPVIRSASVGSTRRSSWTLPKQNISHRRHPGLLGRTSPHSSSKTRKSGNSWKNIQSLQVLIVAIIYLSLSNYHSTLAAPVNSMMQRFEEPEKWINPCGLPDENSGTHELNPGPHLSEQDFLRQIVEQADIAKTDAEEIVDKYIHKTYNMNPRDFHKNWEEIEYKWLLTKNQVPKNIWERVPDSHLQNLDIDQALLDSYEYLQRVAVGLEQMVWDEEDAHGEFASRFEQATNYLKNVLCELQTLMYEKNLRMRPDVRRTIMTDEFRSLGSDKTSSNLRNWIILRDYISLLEYVQQVFSYLKVRVT